MEDQTLDGHVREPLTIRRKPVSRGDAVSASNPNGMPWVVKSWHARAMADTYFDGLERLAGELTRDVRTRRRSLRATARGRASMRASPLAELFRATEEGLPPGGPRFERRAARDASLID
jgi:hypothetical protein